MAKLTCSRRLLKEDFDKKDQDLIDKMAFVLNDYMDQVQNALNKSLNTDNLSRDIVSVTVQNAKGVPSPIVQFKTVVTSRILGLHVINANNLTSPTTYPTSGVFLSWTVNGNIVTVKNITGIQDGNQYQLTVEVIGS